VVTPSVPEPVVVLPVPEVAVAPPVPEPDFTPPVPAVEDDASRIPRLLRSEGVQFVVHLNPYHIITQELPYLTVLWDLEYRHQPYFPEVSDGGEWDRRERHFWGSLRRATWVVTGTSVGKADIEKCFGILGDRIAVVPLPTPSDALAPPPDAGPVLARYGLTEDFLLYPAQFWAHKNHVTLLKALRALRDGYDMRPLLVLAGADHGNKDHVEARAREWGLAEQVRLLGFVPRQDLLALYTRARMLVNPSVFGPDNIPPLEAFALGCPVAYGRVRGAEEQLGDAALLVDLLDAAAWAEAIRSLWTDQALRDRLVERGRLRAARWTSRHVAAAILDLIDQVAAFRELWGG
jgi:glycosyltransferase involved in cell wall biosynthesis